jgi:ribosomal-protein-serine acetyltransferase
MSATTRAKVHKLMNEPAAPTNRPPENLVIGKLALDRWRPEDLDVMFAAVSGTLEHLRPWMSWAADHSRESVKRFLAESHVGWVRGERFEYAIRDLQGHVIGSAALLDRIGPGRLEIGYWVDAAHTRQGVATQAAAALTEAALALSWVTDVEIHHDEANLASRAVARHLGFQLIGTYPQKPTAPAETGREVRWRINMDEFTTSPASQVLKDVRAT